MPRGRPKKVAVSEIPEDKNGNIALPIHPDVQEIFNEKPKPETPKYSAPRLPKWDLVDPKIAKEDRATTWSAVFRCTNPSPVDHEGKPCGPHKTKATNLTPANDVPCHKCGWPTIMVDIFRFPPTNWRERRVKEPDRGDWRDA